jgi:cytoskeletal protein RodZ
MSIKTPKTLGTALKAARTAKGLSIDELAKKARIAKKFILALEQQKYEKLPGSPYIKCFIKNYCQSLGLDEKKIMDLYDKEKKSSKKIDNQPGIEKPVRKISRLNFLVAPKIIRNSIAVIVLIICLAYLGNKIQATIKPPELTIITPATDIITKKNTISVRGKTEPETNLIINGQKVLVQSDGEFFKQLFLQPGVNTIKITAKKRHGAERVEYRRVIVEK